MRPCPSPVAYARGAPSCGRLGDTARSSAAARAGPIATDSTPTISATAALVLAWKYSVGVTASGDSAAWGRRAVMTWRTGDVVGRASSVQQLGAAWSTRARRDTATTSSDPRCALRPPRCIPFMACTLYVLKKPRNVWASWRAVSLPQWGRMAASARARQRWRGSARFGTHFVLKVQTIRQQRFKNASHTDDWRWRAVSSSGL
jgi:hypothetical protein